MPVHDWTLVDAGVFHDFHQSWIISLRNSLNSGLLPNDFYAMAEQVAEGPIPDVVTLERASQDGDATHSGFPKTPISRMWESQFLTPLRKRDLTMTPMPPLCGPLCARRRSACQWRSHRCFHRNCLSWQQAQCCGLTYFVEKLGAAIQSGCHLLVIDPHPPTPRDPRGLHAKFWEDSYGVPTAPGVEPENPLGMARLRLGHATRRVL